MVATVFEGDCLEQMRIFGDDYFDSIVTDPPYGLSFMGKEWDHGVPGVHFWKECLRVAKPGAHMLAFGGTRTHHRLMVAIEDAGWEIRDCLMWVYGSGFPKSLDISKSLDKAAGAEREVVGINEDYLRRKPNGMKTEGATAYGYSQTQQETNANITTPATDAAKQWSGWGTALKPAWEPIILCRKPLDGTVANNVLTWGCGGINVDGCRVEYSSDADKASAIPQGRITTKVGAFAGRTQDGKDAELNRDEWASKQTGRFPANLIHDGSDEVLSVFPDAKGQCAAITGNEPTANGFSGPVKFGGNKNRVSFPAPRGDSGSAARFFYCAKASTSERNIGLNGTCTVKLNTKNNVYSGVCQKDVTTVAVQLLQKVTSESTGIWNIGESGESITARCLWGSLSITLMEINKIIELKTLHLLMHSLTNDTILDANSSTESGGSHAAIVENLKKWILTTTSGKMELARGASDVALQMLLQTSVKENWQNLTNTHSTVKPLALLQYLCRLITPPNGIVLDPFAGSGSTGIAATREGFNSVLIEIDKDYAEIARARNFQKVDNA